MIKDWDIEEIKTEIDKIAFAESDMYDSGFNNWQAKQEMYKLYWYIEEKLINAGTYSPEEEFLKEYDINKMWRILKNDTLV